MQVSGERFEPGAGVVGRRRPVPIRHHADPEAAGRGVVRRLDQDRMIQERLAALEEDPLDRAQIASLIEGLIGLGPG